MTKHERNAGAQDRAEPQSGTRSAQVARSIRETVSAFAEDGLADELIHEALTEAGLASFPESAADLRDFAEVELRHAVANCMGADAAEAVVRGLDSMLSVLARMDVRRSTPPPTTARPPREGPASGSANVARVAILTDDARLAVRVRVALGGGQDLARYASLEELAQRGRVHSSLIIDCRQLKAPSLLVASAEGAREALSRTDVLLLFAGVSERSALRSACPAAGVIVCSSRDVDDRELAELLATFVGTR